MALWRWLKKCLRRSKSSRTTKSGHSKSTKKGLSAGKDSLKVKYTGKSAGETKNTAPLRPKRPSISSDEAESPWSDQHSHGCVCPDNKSSTASLDPMTYTIPHRRGAIISIPPHRRRTVKLLNAHKRPIVRHTLPVHSYHAQVQRLLQQHDGIGRADAPNGIASDADAQHDVEKSNGGAMPEVDGMSRIPLRPETSCTSFYSAKSSKTGANSAIAQAEIEELSTPIEVIRADETSAKDRAEKCDPEGASDHLAQEGKLLPALPAHPQPRIDKLAALPLQHAGQHRGWLPGARSCSPAQLQPLSAHGIMCGIGNESDSDESQGSQKGCSRACQATVADRHDDEEPSLHLDTANASRDDCNTAPGRPASPSPTIQMSRQLHQDPDSPASSHSPNSIAEDDEIGIASAPTANASTAIGRWAAYMSWFISSDARTSDKSADSENNDIQACKNAEMLLALPFASSSLLLCLPPKVNESQPRALVSAHSVAARGPRYDSDTDEDDFAVTVNAGFVI